MKIEKIRSNVSFGQSRMTKATVEPVSGTAGTTFVCNCKNFKPNEKVTIRICYNKHTIYSKRIIINKNGSLGEMHFSTKGLTTGTYEFIVIGLNMLGSPNTAIATFDVE
jgi:hypothetical protein